MFKIIKKLLSFLDLNQSNEEPTENDVTCPNCFGFGSEDLFIICELCDGKGYVSKEKAEQFNNNN